MRRERGLPTNTNFHSQSSKSSKSSKSLTIDVALKLLVKSNGSELFMTVGFPVSMRCHGKIISMCSSLMTMEQVTEAAIKIMTVSQYDEFSREQECNFAVDMTNIGRFRVSALYQKGLPAMVIRRVFSKVPSVDQLGIPKVVHDLVLQPRGLFLIVGPAGSGKSTSLASLINYRNQYGSGHIVTVEDPIEYVHTHEKCMVTQRDVGLDTKSFEVALSNVLRQSPNLIVIGEIRDSITMRHVMQFVETGHLCLATLHSNNSYQALDRILHFFPGEEHRQIQADLSLNIKAIVAQQLVEKADGKGVCLASEVLFNTPYIADLIKKGEVAKISDAIAKGQDSEQGIQSFDQALYELFISGKISEKTAILHATSDHNLRLMIKLSREKVPLGNNTKEKEGDVRSGDPESSDEKDSGLSLVDE